MAKKSDQDDKLTQIVANAISDSLGYDGDELNTNMRDNLARYEGAPYGDERAGRSTVMSRDVLETVEMVMPSLVRCFMSSDAAAIFEPQGPEDEELALQATDYVNHVLMRQNPGFRIASSWMKSALITGSSFAKMWWDDIDKVTTEEYEGLNEQEYQLIVTDEEVEVLEHTAIGVIEESNIALNEEDAMMAAAGGIDDIQATHDLKIKRTVTKGRLRWEAIPPEEFFVNRTARSIDENDSSWTFACHRKLVSVEDLLAQGYDQDKVEGAASYSEEPYDLLTQQRFADMNIATSQYEDLDENTRRVFVFECYLRHDTDGDGISELRKVTALGGASNTVILENETADTLPFAECTAVSRPHRVYGWSLADLTKDLERLKTAILRTQMDGLYQTIYPRTAVDTSRIEDLSDLLSMEPGAVYRTIGDPRSAIQPITTQWSGAQAFPMLQWVDGMLEKRTGVNDLAGGLDKSNITADRMTATAVNEVANSARARVELICRQFAETGWTRLMKLALQMLNKHQNKEEVVRLRGMWTPVDPRAFNVDMDLKINVGLGMGTKQDQVNKLAVIAQKQEQLIMQLGLQNPIAPLPMLYNTYKAMCEAADLNAEAFFMDPTMAMQQQQGQPKAPDPRMIEAQQKMELAKMEAQSRLEQSAQEAQLRSETDRMKAQSDAEIARFKAELAAKTAREAAELKVSQDREEATNRLAFEYEKMRADHEYKMRELEMERQLEADKMAMGSPSGNANINLTD